MEPHEKRARHMASLLDDHRAAVAMLPPQVHAHSLMAAATIHAATQSNLARAIGLNAACKRYAAACVAAVERHASEEALERGALAGLHVLVEDGSDEARVPIPVPTNRALPPAAQEN